MNPYQLLEIQCSLQTIIPIELWEYIFDYKLRLDHLDQLNLSVKMKEICKELVPKDESFFETTICTSYQNPKLNFFLLSEEEVKREYEKKEEEFGRGNYWYKTISHSPFEWDVMEDTISLIKVNVKCGIELLN